MRHCHVSPQRGWRYALLARFPFSCSSRNRRRADSKTAVLDGAGSCAESQASKRAKRSASRAYDRMIFCLAISMLLTLHQRFLKINIIIDIDTASAKHYINSTGQGESDMIYTTKERAEEIAAQLNGDWSPRDGTTARAIHTEHGWTVMCKTFWG